MVTPLKLEQGGRVLLVQRGFVPRDFMDRTKVPQVPTPAGWVEVTGRLAGPPSRVYELGASGTGLIRQNLDMDAFASELKADVILGSLVQLQPDSSRPMMALSAVGPRDGGGTQASRVCLSMVWPQCLDGVFVCLVPNHLPAAGEQPMTASTVVDQPLGPPYTACPSMDVQSLDMASRTRSSRIKLMLLFLVCAAPVIASYFTYYVIRPEGRRNYGELIQPQQPLPAFHATDMQGQVVPLTSLTHQWLIISVADSACNTQCEQHLYLSRQLRESLGKDKDRMDWVWLRTAMPMCCSPCGQGCPPPPC